MLPYRPGDIVRVYNYPFTPKAQQDKNKDNQSIGKPRFGVVINSGGRFTETVPILQISSHSGKTEENDYLRADEVRVPHGTSYKRSSGTIDLYGVIKTERIEQFEQDEISAPLTSIPLRTKLDIISQYEHIKSIPVYQKILNEQSPGHEKAMDIFKESVLAEKLNFLVTDNGKRMFDTMKNSNLSLEEIQPLGKIGKNNSIGIYSLKLKGNQDSFTYTVGTLKKDNQLIKDWSGDMKAHQWLKEDIKYNILTKDIDKNLKPDPLINSDKYVSFEDFTKEVKQKKEIKKDDLEL